MKHLWKIFEDVSGQAINYSKSFVAFNGNLTEFDGQLLVDCLGIAASDFRWSLPQLASPVGKVKKGNVHLYKR